jgi:AcrR family transcriptional regulator
MMRRQAVMADALDTAVSIIETGGAGAVTVSEIARRMGMKSPSLYKYFPSLRSIYDALFERGNVEINAFVDTAVEGAAPGLERLLAASHAVLRWSHANRGLAQLMFWRPIPGFVPSPQSFAPSQGLWQRCRDDLRAAARSGQLTRAADSDDVMRMLTATIGGIWSQQMSNQPDARYDEGLFTGLIDQLLTVFFAYYTPPSRKGTS